jgi:hypothetical protein
MANPADLFVFWTVVLLRLLIPLAIPRFPLPAIIAALLLDAVDQTVFQVFTTMPLDNYQSYDKALDIYYLAIAYIATLRNWTNLAAFRISRFLFYYRLVGVVLFELTQARWLLLLFPNVFEYFFIAYEAYSLRWDPRKLARRAWLGTAAFIWIVIKLPQEYWLHVAQLDVTDVLKTNVLGYPPATPWSAILSANLLGFGLLVFGLALLGIFLWRRLRARLPAPDWPFSFAADAHLPAIRERNVRTMQRFLARRFFDRELLEKTVLVTLLVIIFSNMLSNMALGSLEVVLGVILVILINTLVSEIMVRRGASWSTALRQGAIMMAVNTPTLAVVAFLRHGPLSWSAVSDVLIFALLLSLIITLYDRYRPIHLVRFIAAY